MIRLPFRPSRLLIVTEDSNSGEPVKVCEEANRAAAPLNCTYCAGNRPVKVRLLRFTVTSPPGAPNDPEVRLLAFRFVKAEPFSARKVPPAVRLIAVRLVSAEAFSARKVPPEVMLLAVRFVSAEPL